MAHAEYLKKPKAPSLYSFFNLGATNNYLDKQAFTVIYLFHPTCTNIHWLQLHL